MNKESLYNILELDRDATTEQIKQMYKKLAFKFHPDKLSHLPDGNKEKIYAGERFKKISEAYKILSDDKSREFYDIHGTVENMDQILKQQEIFQNMGINTGIRIPNFNSDIVLKINLTIRQIFDGYYEEKEVEVTKVNIIDGSKHYEKSQVKINIEIPKGAPNGFRKIIRSAGNLICIGGKLKQRGNIIIVVYEMPSAFSRNNIAPQHLIATQKISVFQALLGGYELIITGIDDKKINIKMNNDIIKPSCVIEIADQGMPIFNSNEQRGSLFIIFDIEYPNELNTEQRNTLKKITNYKEKVFDGITPKYITTEDLDNIINNVGQNTHDIFMEHPDYNHGQSQCVHA